MEIETEISAKNVKYKNKIIDLNKICRLCIKEWPILFSAAGRIDNTNWQISEVISICYRITVEDDKKICEECLKKLAMFHSHRLEVLKNDEEYNLHLRQYEKNASLTGNIIVPDAEEISCTNNNTEDDANVEVKIEQVANDFEDSLLGEVKEEIEHIQVEVKIESEDSVSNLNEEDSPSEKIKKKKKSQKSKKRSTKLAEQKFEKCNICAIKVESLDEHFVGHYEIELKCDHCPDSAYDTIQELNSHVSTHPWNVKKMCKVCSRTFYLLQAKQHHYGQHTKEEVEAARIKNRVRVINTPCTHCGRIFKDNSQRNLHEKRMHGIGKGVNCPVCNKRFVTNGSLKAHMHWHTTDRPWVCEYCGRKFRSNVLCKAHIRLHTNELPYHCNDCNRNFRSQSWLDRHKTAKGCAVEKKDRYKMKEDKKEMKCSFCDTTFAKPACYQEHVEEEHPLEAFKCSYCEEKLVNFDEYKDHQQTEHSNKEVAEEIEFYLPCFHCNRVYHGKQKLIRHLYNTKSANKNIFTCNLCDKQFSRKVNMERHIDVVHLKKREYECDVCHKKFGQNMQLQTHYRTHTGEKPYSCKICNTSYGDHSTLWKHNKKHHA